MAKSYIEHTDAADSFVGKEAVDVFACYVQASSMRMFAKTKMKPTRGWTVKSALLWTERATGMKFRPSQLLEAAQWLTIWANAKRHGIKEVSKRASDLAHQYAVIRWMLDDLSMTKDTVKGLLAVQVFDAIDALAERYGLIDPFTDAGVMMLPEERQIRERAIVQLRQIAEEAP